MRRIVPIALGVAVLAVGGWLLVARGSGAQDIPVYPSFGSTPRPGSYESVEDLAADLEADGLPCSLEQQDLTTAGYDSIEGFATCNLFGDPGRNIELWLFASESDRDAWRSAFQTGGLTIFGPNWIVTPQDRERADAVMGAIGGTLVGSVPSTSLSPSPSPSP